MKKKSWLLKLMRIALSAVAVVCIVSALVRQEEPPAEVTNITDVNVADLQESATLWFENLEVLGRYAFLTEDEDDTTGSTDYYVYDDSRPMDQHTLSDQYYLVRFCDKSGKEYVASMGVSESRRLYLSTLSVSADKNIDSLLTNGTGTISACVRAGIIETPKNARSYQKELALLRDSALDTYSQTNQVPRAEIELFYQAESIEQFRAEQENDSLSGRITSAVLGIVLAALLVLNRYWMTKSRNRNTV